MKQNQCVFGLGDCPVLMTLEGLTEGKAIFDKVLPNDPDAAMLSQMIKPLTQLMSNTYQHLPAYCPSCPKRLLYIEKEKGSK